jgi:thiamine-phosphate pyrophosphorylase
VSDALSRRRLASAAARLNAAQAFAGLLPPLALMTDDERLADPHGAAAALPRGSLVIVRSRDSARRAALAHAMLALARRRGLFVLVADDPALAARLGADGLHLPEKRVPEAGRWRARHPAWLISAAMHGARPADPNLDFVFLSPVFATRSHPGRGPIGAIRANLRAQSLSVPVYALGGIEARNARLLHGFAGIAAIGALAI